MTEKEIDQEFNNIRVWIHECIMRMCLNANIDKTKCGHHVLYGFQEFKTAVYDPWTKETSLERHRRIFEIKDFF